MLFIDAALVQRASGPNPRPFGTSVILPADPASRAGSTPEASGDWSSRTFAEEISLFFIMTPIDLTTKIHRGLGLIPQVSGSPVELSLDPVPLLDAALSIADQFADSEDIVEASAVARSYPQRTAAFLAVANILPIEGACRLPEFSSPSLASRNEIALAGLWIQGAIRSGAVDIPRLLQSLKER